MTRKPGSSRRKGKPVAVVKHGSTSVPIYQGMARGFTRFTVAFYREGRRERRTFGSLDAAKEEARMAALNIQRGMSFDNDLRPQDRESLRTALTMLAEFGMPLVSAVAEYVQCRRKLGAMPLMMAVDDCIRRSKGFTDGINVPQVLAELMVVKTQDRMSLVYLESLKSILGRFSEAFPNEIAKITTPQIDAWLRSGDLAMTTRNTWLKRVKMMFSFACERGYLPKGEATAAAALKRGKQVDTDVGIFTPEQMEQLLRAAPAKLLPVLAIGGFAGLRAAEIGRLNWSAVDLDRRIIELRAGQAKTASRRIVPISDNLAAWLKPLERQGPVVPHDDVFRLLTGLARKLDIGWPNNVLRHSYISYRIAVIHDAARVALEAGNSPTIIFKHYRELVTEEAAKKWFAIMPVV